MAGRNRYDILASGARGLRVMAAWALLAATISVVLAVPVNRASASSFTWSLAEDLLSNATSQSPSNPFNDSSGHIATWHMLRASGRDRNPSTYSLLGGFNPNTCGVSGLAGWLGQEFAGINTTDETMNGTPCAAAQLIPPHQAMAHPGPSNLVIFAWKSPITANVSISGGMIDRDCGGGDGVNWYIDRDATDLASGSFGNCGSQLFPSNLTAAVQPGVFLYFIVDLGGNYNFDLTEVDVTIREADQTPALIIGTAEPPANPEGWNSAPVTVSFTCSDADSGVASCSDPTVLSTEGVDQSVTGYAVDNAGNEASTTVGPINIDLTDPVVTCDGSPAFLLNEPGASVSATVTDAISGPQAPSISATVDTSAAGTFTVSLTGSDLAGRSRSVDCPYRVSYSFQGFFSPVDNLPIVNQASAGRTIPIKWRITDYFGVGIADVASFVSITSGGISCDGGDPLDAIESYSGDFGVQYLGDGNWQFNWKTPKAYAGQCRTMSINLADGLGGRIAHFQFK